MADALAGRDNDEQFGPCDETLVLAIQKGFFSKLAFEELLVKRYTERLYCWFFRRGTKPELADDLKQEIFCKFWEDRIRSFDPARGSFQGFLWTTARNLWVQRVKRERHGWAADLYLRA